MTITHERLLQLCVYKDGALTRNNRILGTDNGQGHLATMIDRQRYYVHHLVWLYHYGELPTQLGHLNNNSGDNRIENLAIQTQAENMLHKRKYINNTSGVTGVYWDKHKRRWLASINVDSIKIYLGRFKDKQKAIKARKIAELKYGVINNE